MADKVRTPEETREFLQRMAARAGKRPGGGEWVTVLVATADTLPPANPAFDAAMDEMSASVRALRIELSELERYAGDRWETRHHIDIMRRLIDDIHGKEEP